MPVGSRTLVERHRLGVSSATVRNELSVLEEGGYITQPHTSAGRIPTDHGYRSFVDDLLERELSEEPDEAERAAARQLRESATELDQLMEQTTAALARLTECLSIIVPPSASALVVRQVTFVSLTEYRALVVVVTEDGQVLNRNVEFAEAVSPDDLARVQGLVSSLVVGRRISELKQDAGSVDTSSIDSPLTKLMLEELYACLGDAEVAHAHSIGLTTLMRQPEFSNSLTLIPLLQTLEDDTVLMQLIADVPDETTVRIGHEISAEGLQGVSVVASRFGDAASQGIVAVIGPTRMDYAQVIRAVRTARGALEDE